MYEGCVSAEIGKSIVALPKYVRLIAYFPKEVLDRAGP
jgi:hypothetical protein